MRGRREWPMTEWSKHRQMHSQNAFDTKLKTAWDWRFLELTVHGTSVLRLSLSFVFSDSATCFLCLPGHARVTDQTSFRDASTWTEHRHVLRPRSTWALLGVCFGWQWKVSFDAKHDGYAGSVSGSWWVDLRYQLPKYIDLQQYTGAICVAYHVTGFCTVFNITLHCFRDVLFGKFL